MSVNLRIDPRKAQKFSDLGLPQKLLDSIRFADPLPIQKKILSLNFSGCSVLAHSVPNTGKSTAAILSMLSTTTSTSISNLVLVPSPALADQYEETMRGLDAANHIKRLYRTGSIDLDEKQHQQFENSVTNTLIGTPHRILDYLSTTPNLLPFSGLQQLVIDELDSFTPSKPSEKDSALETLVDFILRVSSPRITALTTSTGAFANFAKLPTILGSSKYPFLEVAEPTPKWPGEIREIRTKDIRKHIDGPGLLVVPPEISPLKFQEALGDAPVLCTNAIDVFGLNIDNLSRIYVVGARADDRLKWLMTGENPVMYILSLE